MALIIVAAVCLCLGFAMGIFVDRNFTSAFSGRVSLRVGQVEISTNTLDQIEQLLPAANELMIIQDIGHQLPFGSIPDATN